MANNQLKITWRNLFKYPVYSFINLTGLSIGIAASFILLLYVRQELTYERGIPDSDRIYRVATDFFNMGGFANSQPMLTYYLANEAKDVEAATGIDRAHQKAIIQVDNQTFKEGNVFLIDSNFFKVFNLPIKEGSIPAELAPNEAIITAAIAEKYYGTASAIGQTITVGEKEAKKVYQIVAVLQKQTNKSHFQPSFLLPRIAPPNAETPNWNSAAIFNYVKLKPGKTQADLRKYLDQLLREHVHPMKAPEMTFEAWSSSNSVVKFFIQPIRDIYLYSTYQFDLSPGGNPTQIRVLGMIALFIILIAVINYINLSTARSSIRAKEVGIKKTLGINRKTLVRQFLLESVLFSVIAMGVAAILSEGLLTVFERITNNKLADSLLDTWQYPAALLGFSILVGLLAGVYPAFYLTSFNPTKVLKGDLALSGNKGLRSGLVILQFTIAIALIISSIVVYQQLQFLQHSDKGLAQEGVLILDNIGELKEKSNAFKNTIEQRAQVVSTSFNSRMPAGNSLWMYTFKTPEMPEDITVQTFPVDEKYLPTLGLHLLQGRNFQKELASDSSAVILNEAAVKALALKEPLGADVGYNRKVVGVIKDFNFQSLRQQIEPVAITYQPEGYNLAIKLRAQGAADFIDYLNQSWKAFGATEPLQYHFLDENFYQLAEKERTLGKAVAFFTLLTIFIACLGLLGLVAFMIEQRTKEIGIRKVLGASVAQITTLLSSDFLRLVLISNGIAFPIAWWVMSKWLQDFAYRIELQWWAFLAAGAMALLLALIMVSIQAIRAAVANPVKSLRSE